MQIVHMSAWCATERSSSAALVAMPVGCASRRRICRRWIARCRLVRKRSTRQLAVRVDAKVAMDVSRFMAPLWRLAGNPAFEQSQQFIFDRLAAAGLQPRYEEYPNERTGLGIRARHRAARRRRPARCCCRRRPHRVALAINSFSTPAGGVTLRLVDAGAGTNDAAYDGKDVKGAVVLVSGSLGAGLERGGAGARRGGRDLERRSHPTRGPAETPDVLQWDSIPYDEALHAFGFKATPTRRDTACAPNWPRATSTLHVDIETGVSSRARIAR